MTQLRSGPTATMGQVPEVLRPWHERMEHYGNPHEHIDLAVAVNVYVAPTQEQAESDIAGLEDVIEKDFARVGNPRTADGKTPDDYEHWEHWEHWDRDRSVAGQIARDAGILPLIGTTEVVIERIETLRSLGINSIRCCRDKFI